MGLLSVLGALAGLLGTILSIWQARAPQREEKEKDDHIQQGREDLVNGNTDGISARIDSVLSDSGGSSAGLESTADIERRISRL